MASLRCICQIVYTRLAARQSREFNWRQPYVPKDAFDVRTPPTARQTWMLEIQAWTSLGKRPDMPGHSYQDDVVLFLAIAALDLQRYRLADEVAHLRQVLAFFFQKKIDDAL